MQVTIPEYDRWAKVPDHLATRTTYAARGLKPAHDAAPMALFYGYRTYPLFEESQCVPRRKVRRDPLRPTDENLARAIQSLSRHAHRSKHPGQCKVRLRAKTQALLHLLGEGRARLSAIQCVNDRECACIEFGGLSFHLPVDRLPARFDVAGLPQATAMTVTSWPKPELTLTQISELLETIGVVSTAISITCPDCLETWRYDRLGTRKERVCPECFEGREARRQELRDLYGDDEDDW